MELFLTFLLPFMLGASQKSATISLEYERVSQGAGVATSASYTLEQSVSITGTSSEINSANYRLSGVVGGDPTTTAVEDWSSLE